jgi:hypothetical protein
MRWRAAWVRREHVTHIALELERVGGRSRGFLAAMRDHSAMSEIERVNAAIAGSAARCCNFSRENVLLTLVLCSVVRATQALAGDQPSIDDSASMFPAPFVSAKPLADDSFSATEFRPRKHDVVGLDTARSAASIIDAPMHRSTSVWQQLADYKSQDRVRLLTLWQMRGSSLSLQAGRRGAPSLQWSTPWVHREGASQGLFDRLFAVPVRAAGNNLRSSVARPTGVAAQPKPLELSSGISTK